MIRSIYKCTDVALSGPKSAGLNCAVPETTEFCPKFHEANSSACVFELKKSTSHVNQKTTTVSVTGTLRGEVEKKAGPLTATASAEVKGGVSHSVTKAKNVTYESRHFLVIPPGFSFCAFTNNTSVPDVNAPTGFRWRCSFPQYVQAAERFSNGRCSSLEICGVGVCGRTSAWRQFCPHRTYGCHTFRDHDIRSYLLATIEISSVRSRDYAKYQIGPGNWYFAKRNISQSAKLHGPGNWYFVKRNISQHKQRNISFRFVSQSIISH